MRRTHWCTLEVWAVFSLHFSSSSPTRWGSPSYLASFCWWQTSAIVRIHAFLRIATDLRYQGRWDFQVNGKTFLVKTTSVKYVRKYRIVDKNNVSLARRHSNYFRKRKRKRNSIFHVIGRFFAQNDESGNPPDRIGWLWRILLERPTVSELHTRLYCIKTTVSRNDAAIRKPV